MFAVEQGVPNRFTGKTPAPKEVVKEANGGTLVIVPVSLLLQWKKEIETKTKGLSMYVHHARCQCVHHHHYHPIHSIPTSIPPSPSYHQVHIPR